jgi:hypothetical protein
MSYRKGVAALLACAAISSLGLLSGCVAGPPPRGVVYVESAPPPDQIEVIGVAPSVEHVWIPGHYNWSGSAYVWVSGRWEVRPHHGARWVRGRWRRHERRWYWVEGHWR